MLVSLDRRLAYLALPKTGTTSIEKALEPLCDIRFGRSPRAKHMTMRTFEQFVLPYLHHVGVDSVETVCVIREPVDWLGSWYRYHGGAWHRNSPKSTRGVSFAEFVEAYLQKPQPPFAKIGRPSRFVVGKGGAPAVTHLFRYEDLSALIRFLGERFDTEFDLPRLKVSRNRDLTLPTELRARLEAERAAEFELYASIA